MAYRAVILADSVSPEGQRLITQEVELPRLVLAEMNTHRMFSRNSASSRAIPVKKQLQKLIAEPFIPEKFGRNQQGMQSYVWLEGIQRDEAERIWLRGRDRAATSTLELLLGEQIAGEIFGYKPETEFATIDMLESGFDAAIKEIDKAQQEDLGTTGILNVHKQLANRLLEPFMWHTVIITATEWSNFYALRDHKDAQAEIRTAARMMHEAMDESTPVELDYGEWHLPLIQPDEITVLELDIKIRVSVGRCARSSYLTHHGVRDITEDTSLYGKLTFGGHMSPTEHPARPIEEGEVQKGNFIGWHQHRADLPHESDFGKIIAERAEQE